MQFNPMIKKGSGSSIPSFSFKPALIALAIGAVNLTLAPSNSLAAEASKNRLVDFNIAAGPLGQVLNQLASRARITLTFNPSQLTGLHSQGLSGTYSIEHALNLVTQGSGFEAIQAQGGGYMLRKSAGMTSLDKVTVTGQEVRFGDAPAEPGGFKAEYQTTATKMAMPLKETPQAISVVTRDLLDARQVKDLAAAVELTSSVSNSVDGAGVLTAPGMFGGQGQYQQRFVMRGQPVVVRGDGFLIGDTTVDLAAYERVEVVKGPSGFYGQGSLGGFINMVRNRPKVDTEVSLSLEAGSYDTYRTEADMTGSLSDDKNLSGRLSFVFEDSGSYVDSVNHQRVMFAPSLEAVINDRTRLLAQFIYQRDRFNANPGVPLQIEGNRLTLVPGFTDREKLYGRVGDESESEIIEILVRGDYEISDKWLASILLQKSKSNRDTVTPLYVSQYDGSLYFYGNRDKNQNDFWAGELRLQGEYDAFGETHQVLMGIEHSDQKITRVWGAAYDPDTYYSPLNLFDQNVTKQPVFGFADIPIEVDRDSYVEQSSFYAQTVLSLNDKAKLLIGGRYDRTKESHIRRQDGGRNDFPEPDSAFTGKVGLSYAISQNITAYGVVAESFSPSYSLGIDGPLDPIMGEGYELGLKTEWFDKKLGANLSVYRQDLTNRPLPDPDNDTYSIAAGLHRTQGIELEIIGSPYPGWTLSASYMLMDNEFLDPDDPNYGLSIDGSVDQQFAMYSQYEFQEGKFKGLGLGATFLHVGERNFINVESSPYEQLSHEGYERVDLNLSYKAIPGWDINVLVRNVADEKYIESATGYYGAGNFFGSPRAVLLTASYNL